VAKKKVKKVESEGVLKEEKKDRRERIRE